MYIIKRAPIVVTAYRLGDHSPMEEQLLAEGKVRLLPDGRYELFSQESRDGSGELAQPGDYFKVDGGGYPYPNERVWFEENHTHLSGDQYRQRTKPLLAWTLEEPMIQEVQYLLDHGLLTICPEDPERCFRAVLWGAPLSGGRDSVVVFYQVDRDPEGCITEISFNFLARTEYERTYQRTET